jgi:hypothetical protein
MRVKNQTMLCSLLICCPAMLLPANAEEQLSLDFLEYLGSEESKVDEKWSSPVDLDIEQYLIAETPPAKSEETKHE